MCVLMNTEIQSLYFAKVLVEVSCEIKVSERKILSIILGIRRSNLQTLLLPLSVLMTCISSLLEAFKCKRLSTLLKLQSCCCEHRQSVDSEAFETRRARKYFYIRYFNASHFRKSTAFRRVRRLLISLVLLRATCRL
jgi:hypothetical protein